MRYRQIYNILKLYKNVTPSYVFGDDFDWCHLVSEVAYTFWHILENTVNFISVAVLDTIYFNPLENRLFQRVKMWQYR